MAYFQLIRYSGVRRKDRSIVTVMLIMVIAGLLLLIMNVNLYHVIFSQK